jgi:hypothetical protein
MRDEDRDAAESPPRGRFGEMRRPLQGVKREMSRIIGPLAGLGLVMLGTGAASAASPIYCALYAKEYAKHAAAESQGSLSPERVHDRAYYKCLNMDDEPVLPTAYAEPDSGVGGPFVEEEGSATPFIEEMEADKPVVDATAIDESIVQQTAALEPDQPVVRKRTGKRRGSGFAMGSPEWKNWCAQHFPKSFDLKTGTIIPLNTGKRTLCR